MKFVKLTLSQSNTETWLNLFTIERMRRQGAYTVIHTKDDVFLVVETPEQIIQKGNE